MSWSQDVLWTCRGEGALMKVKWPSLPEVALVWTMLWTMLAKFTNHQSTNTSIINELILVSHIFICLLFYSAGGILWRLECTSHYFDRILYFVVEVQFRWVITKGLFIIHRSCFALHCRTAMFCSEIVIKCVAVLHWSLIHLNLKCGEAEVICGRKQSRYISTIAQLWCSVNRPSEWDT